MHLAAKPDPYTALRYPSFRYFVIGRTLFMMAVQMQNIAVSWEIYQRLKSNPRQAAVALGIIGLVQVVPVFVLAIPAGHIADRFDRLRIIMVTQLVFVFSTLALLVVSHMDAPVLAYYIILFLGTVGRSFIGPAVSALPSMLVPRAALPNASTWSSMGMQIPAMAGPALGGILIAAAGATIAYSLNLVLALASFALFGLTIPIANRVAAREPVNSILGGVRFVFGAKLLLAVLTVDLFAVLLGGVTALLPIFATDILHMGALGFGFLRAAPAMGAVSMAILTAHLPPWTHAGRAVLSAIAAYGLATLAFGLSKWFWLSMLSLFLIGAFDNISMVIHQTITQMITPDKMRGRVAAVSMIFISSSNELGQFESGITAGWMGPVGSAVFGGVGTLCVVALAAVLFPELRHLGRLHDINAVEIDKATEEQLMETSA